MKNNKIVAVRKDENYAIVGVKLDNGQEFFKDDMKAIPSMVENVQLIQNANVDKGWYLRSVKDLSEGNNLDELPEF